MSRRIMLLAMSFLLGLFSTPTILSNADEFTPSVVAFDDQKTVEVKLKPVQTEVAQARMTQAEAARIDGVPSAPNAAIVQPMLPANYISIFGRTIEVVDVGGAEVDAGNSVNRYGRMLYGHNTEAVFGSLPSLGAGSVFSVTTNGVTVNYQVALTAVFEKAGDYQLRDVNTGGYVPMERISIARYYPDLEHYEPGNWVNYSIALVTCYQDNLHRYVIFANQI